MLSTQFDLLLIFFASDFDLDDPERHKPYLSKIGHGGNSQNFLWKILKIFLTLGLKILILLILKEVFETDILQCCW